MLITGEFITWFGQELWCLLSGCDIEPRLNGLNGYLEMFIVMWLYKLFRFCGLVCFVVEDLERLKLGRKEFDRLLCGLKALWSTMNEVLKNYDLSVN